MAAAEKRAADDDSDDSDDDDDSDDRDDSDDSKGDEPAPETEWVKEGVWGVYEDRVGQVLRDPNSNGEVELHYADDGTWACRKGHSFYI